MVYPVGWDVIYYKSAYLNLPEGMEYLLYIFSKDACLKTIPGAVDSFDGAIKFFVWGYSD